jgi:hypothetical protein
MSSETSQGTRVVRGCAAVIEESIVTLIEIGDDERAERCKSALVALVGKDFGEEYAARTIAEAIEMAGRDLDAYERHQRHHEAAQEFAAAVDDLAGVHDFLNACGEDTQP